MSLNQLLRSSQDDDIKEQSPPTSLTNVSVVSSGTPAVNKFLHNRRMYSVKKSAADLHQTVSEPAALDDEHDDERSEQKKGQFQFHSPNRISSQLEEPQGSMKRSRVSQSLDDNHDLLSNRSHKFDDLINEQLNSQQQQQQQYQQQQSSNSYSFSQHPDRTQVHSASISTPSPYRSSSAVVRRKQGSCQFRRKSWKTKTPSPGGTVHPSLVFDQDTSPQNNQHVDKSDNKNHNNLFQSYESDTSKVTTTPTPPPHQVQLRGTQFDTADASDLAMSQLYDARVHQKTSDSFSLIRTLQTEPEEGDSDSSPAKDISEFEGVRNNTSKHIFSDLPVVEESSRSSSSVTIISQQVLPSYPQNVTAGAHPSEMSINDSKDISNNNNIQVDQSIVKSYSDRNSQSEKEIQQNQSKNTLVQQEQYTASQSSILSPDSSANNRVYDSIFKHNRHPQKQHHSNQQQFKDESRAQQEEISVSNRNHDTSSELAVPKKDKKADTERVPEGVVAYDEQFKDQEAGHLHELWGRDSMNFVDGYVEEQFGLIMNGKKSEGEISKEQGINTVSERSKMDQDLRKISLDIQGEQQKPSADNSRRSSRNSMKRIIVDDHSSSNPRQQQQQLPYISETQTPHEESNEDKAAGTAAAASAHHAIIESNANNQQVLSTIPSQANVNQKKQS